MEILLILIVVQGIMGAFDLIYHHEFLEKLPWRKTAAKELKLHGIRNFFYAIVFFSLGWLEWHGFWGWVFGLILVVEVLITLWDFVEEDMSRKLPATERVSHTLLALNYGAILALFFPIWLEWIAQPDGFEPVTFGLLSWIMAVYTIGVFVWGIRDLSSGIRLARKGEISQKNVHTLTQPNQSILVTGGTGFIGTALCQSLIDQGHRVTVTTRNIKKAAEKFTGRITLIENIEALSELDQFDVVINLAGETIGQRWSGKVQERILKSRSETTEALIKYIARAREKPRLFINSSAIGIYGIDENKKFDETSALNKTPLSFAEKVCFERENSIRPLDMRVCNLRIGLVLEKDGGVLGQMLFPFDFCLGGVIGTGRQWMSWIHRDDLIGLVCHVINSQDIHGTLNATAPEPVRQKDFAKSLAKALVRPAFAPMPAFVVRMIFGKMGEELLLSGQYVYPARAISTGYSFLYPTIDKAMTAIIRGR